MSSTKKLRKSLGYDALLSSLAVVSLAAATEIHAHSKTRDLLSLAWPASPSHKGAHYFRRLASASRSAHRRAENLAPEKIVRLAYEPAMLLVAASQTPSLISRETMTALPLAAPPQMGVESGARRTANQLSGTGPVSFDPNMGSFAQKLNRLSALDQPAKAGHRKGVHIQSHQTKPWAGDDESSLSRDHGSADAPGFLIDMAPHVSGDGLVAPRIEYEPLDLDWSGPPESAAPTLEGAIVVAGILDPFEPDIPPSPKPPSPNDTLVPITIAERRQDHHPEATLGFTGREVSTNPLDPLLGVHAASLGKAGGLDASWISQPVVESGLTEAISSPHLASGGQLPSTEVSSTVGLEKTSLFVSTTATGVNADRQGHDVFEQAGLTMIRLGAIAELLRDSFSAEEWDQIHSSMAINEFVSLEAVKKSGIPLDYDPVDQRLHLTNQDAQPSSGTMNGSPALGGGSGVARGVRYGLIATASAGYDTSPFLFLRQGQGDDTETASARMQLAPSISRMGPRNSFRLSGRAEHVEFFRRFGSQQNFSADLATQNRLSERLQANTGLRFISDVPGANLANPVFDAPVLDGEIISPDLPGLPIGNDITLLGQLQRRTSYGANAGLTYQLSPRDGLRWTVSFAANRFGTVGLADADFASQQLSYLRQVNGVLDLGLLVDASIINFSDAAFGNVRTVSPQFQATARLSDWFEARGSVGVAIARIENPLGNETSTFLSGNVSLCHRRPTNNLCINGSRQVLPAGIGGALIQTTVGASYSARLSERDSVQLGGNFGQASRPLRDGFGSFESINGFARYERQIQARVRFFANAGYQQVTDNLSEEASNIQGSIGISVTFGNTR